MADTVVSDALVFPQDEGYPNITDGSEPWGSAGYLSLLALATANGKFIYDGLAFTGHDALNDQVDLTAGTALLELGSTSVDVQSTLGGSSAPAYDATLPTPGSIMVTLPTTTADLAMTAASLNPVWVAYATDGTVTGVSSGDVYIRHGSAETAPTHPSVKVGETNPDDATADFRAGYDNPPDRHGWREDPASPFEQSVNAGDHLMTLDGHYDQLYVEGICWSDRAQDFGFSVRVNGDSTANYTVVDEGADVRTGRTTWGTLSSGRQSPDDTDGAMASAFAYTLIANWPVGLTDNGPAMYPVQLPIESSGGSIDDFDAGYFEASMTPPITSITHVESNDTGFETRVYGRHTPTRPNLS